MGIFLFLVWLFSVFGVLHFASQHRRGTWVPESGEGAEFTDNPVGSRFQPWLPTPHNPERKPSELSIWTKFDESLINDDRYLLELSKQQARSGNFHLSRIVTERIQEKSLWNEAQLVLAYELAKKQDLINGESIATTIPDDELTDPLLVLIARTYLCAADICLLNGESDWAKSQLEKAVGYLDRLPDIAVEKADALQFAGDCWRWFGDNLMAFETWKRAALLAQECHAAPYTTEPERVNCIQIVIHVTGEIIQNNVTDLETKKKLYALTRPKKWKELMQYPFKDLVFQQSAVEQTSQVSE